MGLEDVSALVEIQLKLEYYLYLCNLSVGWDFSAGNKATGLTGGLLFFRGQIHFRLDALGG